jgi:hypothetical protein
MTLSRRAIVVVLVVLWTLGTLRAAALFLHDPLYAYANSYDETRYTTCFHFYPDRPSEIAPEAHSPEAPFAKFRFVETGDPMCYWSTELLFGAAAAAGWSASEAFGGLPVHDVRPVATLRWLAMLAVSIALSIAWLRRGDGRAAIANAALVPLVFADPGNTLYLATFYAEWTALVVAYALIATLVLWRAAPRSRGRFAVLALLAFALAASKMQHMLLPLAIAGVVFALDRWQPGRTMWRAIALAVGATLGLAMQFVQSSRGGLMIDTIRQYNNADVVFTALVPFADDPRALLDELGIDPDCAIYSGKRAWQLPNLPDRVCHGLADFSRTKELAVLARHPSIAIGLGGSGLFALEPWLADNVGHVEGGTFAKLPSAVPTIGRILSVHPAIQLILLTLPIAVLGVLIIRRRSRCGHALATTALVVTTMAATFAVTLLGDGLADAAKQGHLVVNAALAWLVAGLMMYASPRRRGRASHEASTTTDSVPPPRSPETYDCRPDGSHRLARASR